jgi:hypothetical protein
MNASAAIAKRSVAGSEQQTAGDKEVFLSCALFAIGYSLMSRRTVMNKAGCSLPAS